ncbi:MAG TPA: tetratricopeptide repeat protein [Planctomycetota bacterium]|nr:tetratricopeptide repeat protein [Planctomycetota bacterium]
MKKRHALLLFLGVSFGLYANALRGGFIFDDHSTFRKKAVREQPISELLDDYRPLRYISYRLDEWILGSDAPWVYHVFNTLYHGLTSFVVFLVLRRLAGERAALAGALLFAAHPVQTESVAYLSGRRDVLSTLFYMLAFLAWTRTRTSWFEISMKARARQLMPALLFFVMAFFTKEMAASLPLVCLLFDAVIAPSRARRRFRATALWPRFLVRGRHIAKPALYAAGAAAGLGAVAYVLLGGATRQPFYGGTWISHYATAAGLLSHYALLLLFPLRLLGDHSYDAYPLCHSFLEPKVLVSLAALAFGIVLAIRVRRRAPLVTFGLAWIVFTLLPVLQIKPFHEIAADHFLYLPSVGFCLLLGLGFDRLASRLRPRIAWIALGILLGAYSVRTVVRNRDWQDDETFWRVTLADAPRCARASFNLGTIYAQRAKAAKEPAAATSLWNTAAFYMRRAVDIKPDYAVARVNLGRVYATLGDKDAADAQWEEALRIVEPMDWPSVDPGLVCLFLGQYDRALATYEQMLAKGARVKVALQGLLTCHRYLGNRAMIDGRRQDAIPHFKKALEAAERLLLEKADDARLLSDAADLARDTGDRRREAELRARLRRAAPPR